MNFRLAVAPAYSLKMTVFNLDAVVTYDTNQTLQAAQQGSGATDFSLVAHQPFGDCVDLGAPLDTEYPSIARGMYGVKDGELSNASGS